MEKRYRLVAMAERSAGLGKVFRGRPTRFRGGGGRFGRCSAEGSVWGDGTVPGARGANGGGQAAPLLVFGEFTAAVGLPHVCRGGGVGFICARYWGSNRNDVRRFHGRGAGAGDEPLPEPVAVACGQAERRAGPVHARKMSGVLCGADATPAGDVLCGRGAGNLEVPDREHNVSRPSQRICEILLDPACPTASGCPRGLNCYANCHASCETGAGRRSVNASTDRKLEPSTNKPKGWSAPAVSWGGLKVDWG